MRSFSLASFATLTLSLLVPMLMGGCASSLHQDRWIEVSSPRFEIFSTMGIDDSVALARELERFHALIYRVTSADNVDSPIPTQIFAFEHASDLNRFTGSKQVAGRFVAGLRQNQILLTNTSRQLGASEIILHEYVHFVVRNGSKTVYPVWYDEGFAEFLSTAKVREEHMAIGIVPKVRIPSFRYEKWIPMGKVISTTSYSDHPKSSLSMFYAEAWALVHHLTLGRPGSPGMATELNGYLLRVANGVPNEVAFQHAFGESIEDLDEKAMRWLGKRKWTILGIPLADLDYDRSEPVVRIPSEDAVAVQLGQLAMTSGLTVEAGQYFRAALERNPANARAHAGLGDVLKFEKRWNEAAPYFQRAVELGPDDALNLLDQAEYFYDRASEEGATDANERTEILLKSRALSARSLELDPSSPEIWAQMGRTYLVLGDEPLKGLEMIEHAFELLPSSPQLSDLLVEAYVVTGQEGNARDLLTRSFAFREKGELEENLRKRIGEIRKRVFGTDQQEKDVEAPDGLSGGS